jgi:hypothetical protein
MMIGPEPMIRMVSMSVRLGIEKGNKRPAPLSGKDNLAFLGNRPQAAPPGARQTGGGVRQNSEYRATARYFGLEIV